MTLAVVAALAMTTVAFFVDMPAALTENAGICLPSPDAWGLPRVAAWIANTALIFACGGLISWVNKEFRLTATSDPVWQGMFLVAATSNVWLSGMFSASALLALVNIACLMVLFGCYKQRNATRELFVIGTILAIGSMFEYAFLFMTPVFIIGAIMLKCFSFKALVAFIMGLAAPYWVGIGFGIIDPVSLEWPIFRHPFEGYASHTDLLVGLLNVGITVIGALLLSLSNAVRLYAGNSRRRIFNMTLNLLGAVACICMVFDFQNLTVYLATIYLVAALQMANMMEFSNPRRPGWWLLSIGMVYAGAFVLMITL